MRCPAVLIPALVAFLGVVAASSMAEPVAAPVVEGFDTGVNNWRDASSAELTFVPAGGPDGSSYASTNFNLVNAVGGAPGSREASTILLRGQKLAVPGIGEFVASDGAFFGDWLSGVGELRLMVRHNTPEDLLFFARIAVPVNSPAYGVNFPTTVAPNEWTELVIPIDFDSPSLFPQGAGVPEQLFETVFSNVGNIQFGFYTPVSLAGIDQQYTLDIDNITLTKVPEPATLALAVIAGAAFLALRRADSRKRA